MRTYLLSLATIVWAVALAAPASADITLLSSNLRVSMDDGDGTFLGSTLTPSSLPFSASHIRAFGGASARSTYDFSASGDTGLFSVDFVHVRVGREDSSALGIGVFRFQVTNDVLYSLDGIYTLTGSQRVFQHLQLLDESAGFATVFHNNQSSLVTPNESFTLGLEEGDEDNLLQGNISGTLTAGHIYRLDYSYLIRAQSDGSGATSLWAAST